MGPSAITNEDCWACYELDRDNRSVFLDKASKEGLDFEGGAFQIYQKGAWAWGQRRLAAVKDARGEQDGKRERDREGQEVENPILH